MDSVSIRLKVDGVLVNTHPVFGDDLKIKLSKEEYQAFHRAKIDGSVKFVGEDFAFIANSNHNVTFTLSVYRGATLVGESNFLKSDCELNYIVLFVVETVFSEAADFRVAVLNLTACSGD